MLLYNYYSWPDENKEKLDKLIGRILDGAMANGGTITSAEAEVIVKLALGPEKS